MPALHTPADLLVPPPCVQPRQGDCLLFFPAFADGRLDGRMAHEGLPVQAGEKWIINVRRPCWLAVMPLL